MNEKLQKYIRYILIGFSILFLLLGVFKIIQTLNIETLTSQNLNSYIISIIIYLVLGYILFKIATTWENILKSITSILITIAIFFITIFLLLIPIEQNSQNITQSIQPSIDYFLMSNIDEILNKQINIENNYINIQFSNNTDIYKIENHNISNSEINLISKRILNLQNTTNKEEKIISKIFITEIDSYIKKNNPKLLDTPIPENEIKNMVKNKINLDILNSINIEFLETMYDINNNATVKIMTFDKYYIKKININKIKNEDINLIWNSLELNHNISIETKKKTIILILSNIANKLNNQQYQNQAIPINNLKNFIEKDTKIILSYDLFSNNMSTRINELNKLRNYCQKNNLSNNINNIDEQKNYLNQICNMVSITKYNNLMKNIQNESNELNNNQVNFIDIEKTIEPISSIEKIKNKIKNTKKIGYTSLIIGILLFLISFITYYLHLRLNKKNIEKTEISYQITKSNLISYIFNYIVIFIIFILISFNLIFEVIGKLILSNPIDTSSLNQIEIFKIIKIINFDVFIFFNIYLLFSIILFIICRFFYKKQPKNFELKLN